MDIGYLVWEPAIEQIGMADAVDAQTPCQAAFLLANARKIGHRLVEFAVCYRDDVTLVKVEPQTVYSVSEVPKPPEDSPGVA